MLILGFDLKIDLGFDFGCWFGDGFEVVDFGFDWKFDLRFLFYWYICVWVYGERGVVMVDERGLTQEGYNGYSLSFGC